MSNDEEGLSQEEYEAAVEAAQEDVRGAISNYLQVARQGSLIVTKFAVVGETYRTEEDGVEAKSLVHFEDNMVPWEIYGMLSMVCKDVWADSRIFEYEENDEI